MSTPAESYLLGARPLGEVGRKRRLHRGGAPLPLRPIRSTRRPPQSHGAALTQRRHPLPHLHKTVQRGGGRFPPRRAGAAAGSCISREVDARARVVAPHTATAAATAPLCPRQLSPPDMPPAERADRARVSRAVREPTRRAGWGVGSAGFQVSSVVVRPPHKVVVRSGQAGSSTDQADVVRGGVRPSQPLRNS
eukprot:2439475-Pyramimonas_sp.AAC.1